MCPSIFLQDLPLALSLECFVIDLLLFILFLVFITRAVAEDGVEIFKGSGRGPPPSLHFTADLDSELGRLINPFFYVAVDLSLRQTQKCPYSDPCCATTCCPAGTKCVCMLTSFQRSVSFLSRCVALSYIKFIPLKNIFAEL
jgi:hypothetical protein